MRKFFFFLDPMRTGRPREGVDLVLSAKTPIMISLKKIFFYCQGKIKIQDILACGFLDDLLEVRCVLKHSIQLYKAKMKVVHTNMDSVISIH